MGVHVWDRSRWADELPDWPRHQTKQGCDMQSMVTWVSKTNWHHLAGMLWRDMRQLAMRLDNKQRLGLCWVNLAS